MITREAILREGSRVFARLRADEGGGFWSWVDETFLLPIRELVEQAVRRLFEMTGMVPGWILVASAAALALAMLVWLGLLLFRRAEAARTVEAEEAVDARTRLAADPEAAESEAARLASQGKFAEALRLLYFAAFARLHRRSGRPFDPSLTPGENLRPYRRSPFFAGLRDFVNRYQAVSFGKAPLDRPGYEIAAGLRPSEAAR